MSFRSAVGSDENFIWCQNCDFGQLHEGGMSQPIVRCLKCGQRSCFRHSVPWHDRLTCAEYDEMLEDPDGFQSALDTEELAAADAAAEAERAKTLMEQDDEVLARRVDEQERQAEEDRQRQRHQQKRREAQAAQLAEAERLKMERDRKTHEEEKKRAAAARQAEAEAERIRAIQENIRQKEEIKRRAKENKLSVEKVHATTKQCPGCRWSIEKNLGCAHMTCKPVPVSMRNIQKLCFEQALVHRVHILPR